LRLLRNQPAGLYPPIVLLLLLLRPLLRRQRHKHLRLRCRRWRRCRTSAWRQYRLQPAVGIGVCISTTITNMSLAVLFAQALGFAVDFGLATACLALFCFVQLLGLLVILPFELALLRLVLLVQRGCLLPQPCGFGFEFPLRARIGGRLACRVVRQATVWRLL